MGKKNLDKLFQEKLGSFKDTPDEKVWQSIDASLDKKKKSKKVIPLWWKIGGAAAVLLVAIFALSTFEPSIKNTPKVSEIEKSKDQVQPNINSSNDKLLKAKEQEEIELVGTQNSKNDLNTTTTKDVASPAITEVPVKQNVKNKLNTATDKSPQITSNEPVNLQKLSGETDSNSFSQSKHEKINANAIDSQTKDAVAAAEEQESTPFDKLNKSQEVVSDQVIAEASSKEKDMSNEVSSAPEIALDPSNKKSIFDEIADAKEEEDAMLAEKEDGKKWSAGPSIAPVYFDALGDGSPVHSIFVPNSKSGDLNLSYGLSVAYEINKKLSLRSGVHKVDYGYSTNDVEFSSSLEGASSSQLANVNYSATSKNLVVSSSANKVAASNDFQGLEADALEISATSVSQNGIMSQNFSYLEVPIELKYDVLDNKFGVHLIGGISSLLLVDNSISLTSGALTTSMGEANNVNSINFSTNVGLGVNYKFTPKVQLNIEPVFKYQLNTFSQTDGRFQPFSVGVYSGLNFKF